MRYLIITVDYNSNNFTRKFINSISKIVNKEEIDIYVVCNGNELYTDEKNNNLKINVIKTDNNGYFGAVKYVLDRIQKSLFDYIIICNNDIEILTNNFFKKLSKVKYEIIAPRIKNLQDLDQNPHRLNPPSFKIKLFYKLYFINYALAYFINYVLSLRRKKIKDRFNHNIERFIFSPHGSFIIFSKLFFEKGGYIDNNFFLYGEEDSIGSIAYQLNMKVLYYPQINLIHHESVSTGKSFSFFKWNEQKKSHKYIKKNYKIFSYNQ